MKLFKLKNKRGQFFYVVAAHPTQAVDKFLEGKHNYSSEYTDIVSIEVFASESEEDLIL